MSLTMGDREAIFRTSAPSRQYRTSKARTLFEPADTMFGRNK
jgi:hypothetical protein